ncbi:helix-turn-helix transcriptional regulator [Paenibacillus sp. J5C_2022]|uniref:helix-turn-helix domain-containing protein n=1 Tax=Paenibacillus sp. J5C2022 TaxID=2977129 RepID=UPI0021D13389|nr:helix-turn-helix transcriptional regulator [Paenibacillus sp. J5C2022]MCU6709791.1 helix-turn-helix transcriptional regulator [Paenibacillus sp. J5C2022]
MSTERNISSIFKRVKQPHEVKEDEDYGSTFRIEFRLHLVLKQRNLKQRDLARMTGLRPNAISNIYRGFPERLSIDHIERIANALGITDIRELIVLVPEEDHDFWQVGKEGHSEDSE